MAQHLREYQDLLNVKMALDRENGLQVLKLTVSNKHNLEPLQFRLLKSIHPDISSFWSSENCWKERRHTSAQACPMEQPPTASTTATCPSPRQALPGPLPPRPPGRAGRRTRLRRRARRRLLKWRWRRMKRQTFSPTARKRQKWSKTKRELWPYSSEDFTTYISLFTTPDICCVFI